MAAVATYVDDDVASYVGDDMASYMDDDMTSYVDNDVASYVDDNVASYVDNDVASFVDDDVASYVDDGVASYVDNDVAPYVDDDVAKILSPTDTNSGPPQPISELYSSIKLAKLAHLQSIFQRVHFPTHLPKFNEQTNQIQLDTISGQKKTQQTQSDIEADNTCFQMSTIPKTLHLPLCYSATLFSDSLRVRINLEIKETGIQLEKTNPDTPSAALHQLAIQLYSWSWNRIVNRRSTAQNQALINKTSKDNLIGFKC
jgi:hypothetical protein